MASVFNIPVGADMGPFERAVQNSVNRVTRKSYQIKIDDKASSALGNITGKTTKFNDALDAATARVVAFGAAAGAFNLVRKGVEELLRATIDVEQSLVRININLNESQEGLKQFSKNIFDIAKNTGQTFEVAAKAAEELTRQGLTAVETTKRLRDALILSRLAAIDSDEAVNTLTASINSFSKEALSSTEILNKLAAVDAKFAVSTNDLAQAVSRVGSSASEAGVSFNELLAIVTSVQQTTARGGAVIGNALKTIFTRVERSGTLDDLQALGIGVRDLQGKTLPAIQILKNLASTYNTLSQSQRSLVAEQVGGVFQINILKAALGDLGKEYSTYDRALQVAAGASDEALRKNDALNKTLASSINDLKQSITELFAEFGKINLNPFIKTITDSLSGVAKFLSGSKLGEDSGKTIGENIVQGIGNVLTGPGVIALAAIVQSVVTTLARKVGAEFGQALSSSLLASGAVSGIGQAGKIAQTRKIIPRAAGGLLPSIIGESASISAGIGGASSSAKPVVIPNFNFGGGKKGPVVANTSEYIVPNYANSGGSAIFNQNMIKSFGMPKGAQKLATGYIPNFATIKSRKASDGLLGSLRELSTDNGSYLKYFFDKDSKRIDIDYIRSAKKGEAFQLFNEVGKRAKRLGAPLYTGVLEPQERQITKDSTNYDNLLEIFPQLRYRDQKGLKNKGLIGIDTTSSIASYEEKTFRSLSGLKSYINSFDRADFIKKLVNEKISLSDIQTSFAKGYVPNFADRLFRGVGGKGGDEFLRQLLIGGSARSAGKGGGQGGGVIYASSDKNIAQEYAASYATKTLNSGAKDKGYIFGISSDRAINPNIDKPHLKEKILPSLLSSEVSTIQRVKTISDSDGYGYQTRLGKPLDFKRFADKYRKLYLPQFASGFIPNFATSQADFFRNYFKSSGPALSNAIKREKAAGVPLSSIYIDKDKRAASSGNPLGLLVANRRDEPSGGFQGVNRALSMGLNPSTHGSNEDGYNLSHFYNKAKGYIPNFATISPDREDAFSRKDFSSRGFFISSEKLKELNSLFNTMGKVNGKAFDKILSDIQKIEKDVGGKAGDLITGRRLGRLKQRKNLAFEAEGIPFDEPASTARTSSGTGFVPKLPQINPAFEVADRRAALLISKEKKENKYRDIISKLEQGDTIGYDEKAFLRNETRRRVIKSKEFNKLNPRQIQQSAALSQLAEERTSSVIDPLLQKNAQNQAVKRSLIPQKKSFFSSEKILPLSILASFAGPTLENLVKGESKSGSGRAVLGGAVGGAAQGLSIGGFLGPAGAVAGTIIGGLTGAFSNLTKSVEEFEQELEKGTAAQSKNIDALQQYLQTRSQLDDANVNGASSDVKNRLKEKLSEQFSSLNQETAKKISGASNEDIFKVLQDESNLAEKNSRINKQRLSVFSVSGGVDNSLGSTYKEGLKTTNRIALGIGTAGISEFKITKDIISAIKSATSGANKAELVGREIGSDINNREALSNVKNRKALIGVLGNEQAGRSSENRNLLQEALAKIPAFENVKVTAENFNDLNTVLNQAATTSRNLSLKLKEQNSQEEKRAAFFSKISTINNFLKTDFEKREISKQGLQERRGVFEQTRLSLIEPTATAADFSKIKLQSQLGELDTQNKSKIDTLNGQLENTLRDIFASKGTFGENTDKIVASKDRAQLIGLAQKSGPAEAQKALQEYNQEIEKNKILVEESRKTIEQRNVLEAAYSNITRKRNAFLNSPTLGGNEALSGLASANNAIRTGGGANYDTQRINRNDALIGVGNEIKSLTGSSSFLTSDFTAAISKATLSKQKDSAKNFAANALQSIFYENPSNFRTENGGLRDAKFYETSLKTAIKNTSGDDRALAKEALAQLTDQTNRKSPEDDTRELFKTQADLLKQQQENIDKLAKTSVKVDAVVSGTVNIISEAFSEGQNKTMQEAINEAVNQAIYRVYGNLKDKIDKESGKPNPPQNKEAPVAKVVQNGNKIVKNIK